MKRINVIVFTFLLLNFILVYPIYADNPASDNYRLRDYNFGAGGTDNSSSDNYSIYGTLGEVAGAPAASDNFMMNSGLTYGITSSTPPTPSLTNASGNDYNTLHLVIDNTGNPESDVVFAVAISTDNFVSDTQYIQDDNTIGSTLSSEDWQSYTTWGGGSGVNIIGLDPGTTYTVKVSAMQGGQTQSPFGPTDSAATVNPSLTFDIDVSATDSESSAPYSVEFGNLSLSSVSTATDKIWIDLSTNAANGGFVYIYDQHGGLRSDTTSYTISSLTGNLASNPEGFGIRSNSTNQSAGGPLNATSPYDQTSDNVGTVDTTVREVYNSSNNPISNGRGSIVLKAKMKNTTPASNDYSDTLTLIASGTF